MVHIPNWLFHLKWALKLGIEENRANFVNRSIDYGSDWCQNQTLKKNELIEHDEIEPVMKQQLKYFFKKDPINMEFVKAAYLHYLLDYFRETRYNIEDFELIFTKFKKEKIVCSILNHNGEQINFNHILEEIFSFLKKNKRDFLTDLLG